MGRKKLSRPPLEDVYESIAKILVPAEILEDFEIYGAKENKVQWTIELREKLYKVPVALQGIPDIVFDGFTNPIEVMSQSFSCKPVFLKIYRRRYKQSNKDEHFSNEYSFTLSGTKLVPAMGTFLKGEDRKRRSG